MEKIIKQIEIYHNLYVISLLAALIFLIAMSILFIRWEMYRSFKFVLKKNGKRGKKLLMKKEAEEIINEKTNSTIKLKPVVCDVTEFISVRTQLDEF